MTNTMTIQKTKMEQVREAQDLAIRYHKGTLSNTLQWHYETIKEEIAIELKELKGSI